MKITVAILLTALLCFVGGLYLPWWSIALAAFIVALIVPQKPWVSWATGFVGVFLLWGVLAWWIDMKNQSILSARIGLIIPVNGSAFLLILITAFIGAIVAGFGALSGTYLRQSR